MRRLDTILTKSEPEAEVHVDDDMVYLSMDVGAEHERDSIRVDVSPHQIIVDVRNTHVQWALPIHRVTPLQVGVIPDTATASFRNGTLYVTVKREVSLKRKKVNTNGD